MRKLRKIVRRRAKSPAQPPKAVLVQGARLGDGPAGEVTLCWPDYGAVYELTAYLRRSGGRPLAEATR